MFPFVLQTGHTNSISVTFFDQDNSIIRIISFLSEDDFEMKKSAPD
jgi:uncharacterized DUF497 family protein